MYNERYTLKDALHMVSSQYPGNDEETTKEMAKNILYICSKFQESPERALLFYDSYMEKVKKILKIQSKYRETYGNKWPTAYAEDEENGCLMKLDRE